LNTPKEPAAITVPEAKAVVVTVLEGELAGPIPPAFVAVTVNVYAVPEANPGTVIGEEAPLAVSPPGLEVAV
jgi:hypothetical protein